MNNGPIKGRYHPFQSGFLECSKLSVSFNTKHFAIKTEKDEIKRGKIKRSFEEDGGGVKPKKRMRLINKATLDHVLSFRPTKSKRAALIFS